MSGLMKWYYAHGDTSRATGSKVQQAIAIAAHYQPAFCLTCNASVEVETDNSGGLIQYNAGSNTPHKHQITRMRSV